MASKGTRYDTEYVVDEATGCWVWRKYKDPEGYGRGQAADRRSVIAHRLLYEREVGPILEGHVLHHRCENPSCVNPEHLEPLTRADHAALGNKNGRKTHCPKGHPYSEANTYVDRRGCRVCRRCTADAQRRYQKRKRMEAAVS